MSIIFKRVHLYISHRCVKMSNLSDVDLICRQNSLEEDLFMPDLLFSDHVGNGKNNTLLNGVFYGTDHQTAKYQRFSRIAAAQEMEDFGTSLFCY